MAADDQPLVVLARPLPCTVEQDPPLYALATAIGEEGLLLRLPGGAEVSEGELPPLRLELADGGELRLSGRTAPPDAADPEALHVRLADLEPEAEQLLQGLSHESRKADHIRICLEEEVGVPFTAGFDRYRLPHHTLPEVDLHRVELATTFLGRRLAAPLLISCMTGGSQEAGRINRHLAQAAQQTGVALGLGSMRILLEKPDALPTFAVRQEAPDVLLLANIGVVQLNYGVGLDDLNRLVEMTGADALVFHSNPMQEAIQPEGDVNFAGLEEKLADLVPRLQVPAILKEIGFGVSGRVAARAEELGFAAIDVAGSGGTSWALVEGLRSRSPERQALGRAFAHWGIPTVDSLMACRRAAADTELIASGGVRSGQDILKAIALGARLGGIARPFLEAAARSADACVQAIEQLEAEMRIAMFCMGCTTVSDVAATEFEEAPST